MKINISDMMDRWEGEVPKLEEVPAPEPDLLRQRTLSKVREAAPSGKRRRLAPALVIAAAALVCVAGVSAATGQLQAVLSLPWQNDETKERATRITTGGNPRRFDVVICRYPGRGGTNFVKRVVGLPGDTVEIRNGYLYINGGKYDEPYIRDEYRNGSLNTFGPYTVPEGEYFVLGDHRNNSNDSRLQGSLPRDMIIGHVRFVFFPFSNWRGVK